MTMTTFFLNLLALGTIISGIFSITSKNPIISVIFLISTFVQAAGYLIFIGINFIGISYIVIYVGAIAVLFLFVIMMINIKLTDILESGNQYTKNLPLAIVIGTLFLYLIFTILTYNSHNNPLSYEITNKIIELNNSLNSINNIINSIYNNSIGGANNLFSWSNINLFTNLNELPLNINLLTNSDIYFTYFSQIKVLGLNLYIEGSILLIILSFILLLSMLAIIIISSNNK